MIKQNESELIMTDNENLVLNFIELYSAENPIKIEQYGSRSRDIAILRERKKKLKAIIYCTWQVQTQFA